MENIDHLGKYAEGLKGNENPNWRGGKYFTCPVCEKRFWVIPSHFDKRKYCSKKCKGIAQQKKITVKCATCNKEFDICLTYYRRKRNKRYCSRECYKMDGKFNPNWKGGYSFKPYPSGWTEILKESIRQRDNYKCQMCGVPQCETMRKLPIHHIDEDKNNLNPKNLITLCNSCHNKVRFNPDLLVTIVMA